MPRAIARAHKRLGVMPCLVCNREIPVKKTEGGKLSCACSWCDAPIYINAGSEAHELIMRRVKLDAPPAAADPGTAASESAIAKPLAPPPAPPAPEKQAPRRTFAGPLFGGPIGGS